MRTSCLVVTSYVVGRASILAFQADMLHCAWKAWCWKNNTGKKASNGVEMSTRVTYVVPVIVLN